MATKKKAATKKRAAAPKARKAAPKATVAAVGGKKAAVEALVRRANGATLAEIQAATGWQPHTCRGLLSRMGVASVKGEDGVRRYVTK